ncbi:hypothetical protein ACFSWE_14325 [Leucobacter albus]
MAQMVALSESLSEIGASIDLPSAKAVASLAKSLSVFSEATGAILEKAYAPLASLAETLSVVSEVTAMSNASWTAPLATLVETLPDFTQTLGATAAAVTRIPLQGMLDSLSLTAKSLDLVTPSVAALVEDLAFANFDAQRMISGLPAYAGLESLNGLFGNISAQMGLAGALSPEVRTKPGTEGYQDEFVRVVREGWTVQGTAARTGQDDAARSCDVVPYKDDQGRLTNTVATVMALVVGAVAWTADLTMNSAPSPVAALLVAGAVFGWCRKQR